jgi:hypothetical protein
VQDETWKSFWITSFDILSNCIIAPFMISPIENLPGNSQHLNHEKNIQQELVGV